MLYSAEAAASFAAFAVRVSSIRRFSCSVGTFGQLLADFVLPALAAQRGSPLRSLAIYSGTADALQGLLPAVVSLSSLRRLELHSQLVAIELPEALSSLCALTTLHMVTPEAAFSGGCLPASLRVLQSNIDPGPAAGLPPAVLAATGLESLLLNVRGRLGEAELSTAGLERLSRLTALGLFGARFGQLPPQLAQLPALRSLALRGTYLRRPDFGPLLALRELRELDVVVCGLHEAPLELMEWGQLTVRTRGRCMTGRGLHAEGGACPCTGRAGRGMLAVSARAVQRAVLAG